MGTTSKGIAKLSTLSAAILLAACSATDPVATGPSQAELEARTKALNEREAAVAKREADARAAAKEAQQIRAQAVSAAESLGKKAASSELLPPNAEPGACYARVFVEPTYESYQETVVAREASERVDVIPARYEKVSQRIEVQPASFRIQSTPAKYKTVSERTLVKAAGTEWKVSLKRGSAPASAELLKAATDHGIDLAAAKPGMCFHEHFIPAKYEKQTESVLVQDAYDKVRVQPAKYRWVEKQVLIQEAGTRIEKVPAKYRTETEQVVDVPAHTIWKKGTGPIQKIDAATGEIMCLVEVPATYKTISKRVLESTASTRTVEVPAVYKTVRVKELVQEAREVRETVAAKYKQVPVSKKVADVRFTWHEIHNHDHPASTRTGNKICLTETPAQYKTVKRTVVVQEAQSRKVEIPAQYETVQVTKLVSPAQEKRVKIPAEYKTVSRSKLVKDGFMEWRSILCETNMTRATIMDIQRALEAKGYNPGNIDGVVGTDTMGAVNKFQRDNKLPTDKYINIETVKALNVQI